MHQPDSPVVSFLFCGAPEDPATPTTEQANLYATLTELNHFADPGHPVRRPVRARRAAAGRAGTAFRPGVLAGPAAPLAGGAARCVVARGQLPVPRDDHALEPSVGSEQAEAECRIALPQSWDVRRVVPARVAAADGGAQRLPAFAGGVAIRRRARSERSREIAPGDGPRPRRRRSGTIARRPGDAHRRAGRRSHGRSAGRGADALADDGGGAIHAADGPGRSGRVGAADDRAACATGWAAASLRPA